MGLFNSGKNEKVEKVSKYERHYNVPSGQQAAAPPSSSSRRRSSKHRSQGNEPHIRAMSQPPMMRLPGNPFYPGVNNYLPPPSMNNQIRYPMIPFDLSKYPTGNAFANPMSPMNIQPNWNQAMPFIQQQFPFQQQTNWPMASPANYPFLQNIQF